MDNRLLLISTGNLTPKTLADQVAIVTGAGGGIGFEAARALAWLGARVIIAEVDPKKGSQAESMLRAELGPAAACFILTDIGDEASVEKLAREAFQAYGKVDIVLNNATVAPLGGVIERPIRDWDLSYRVNLRGPVLLAQAFLPGMIQRKYGVFACVSSAGGPYMGAYETIKTAQVELARTLDGELEGTGVLAFTIGPGIVPTETMAAGVALIAPYYGKTPEEFYELYKDQWISVEAAGAGFAAGVALAEQFRGMEIWSNQALIAAGINVPDVVKDAIKTAPTAGPGKSAGELLALCREVRERLAAEHAGWLKRSLFERNWMLRDFKQHAGATADQALEELANLEGCLERGETAGLARYQPTALKLAGYYQHYQDLTRSSIKDPAKLREWLGLIQGWEEAARRLGEALGG